MIGTDIRFASDNVLSLVAKLQNDETRTKSVQYGFVDSPAKPTAVFGELESDIPLTISISCDKTTTLSLPHLTPITHG